MIYTVTLNPAVDYTLTLDRLIPGQIHKYSRFRETPGGKGVNVSRVLRELGVPYQSFLPLGGSFGSAQRSLLEKYKINFSAVAIKESTRLNITLETGKTRKQTKLNQSGPLLMQKEIRALECRLLSARPKPLFWVFGGSLCPGCPVNLYENLLRRLQTNGVGCLLDSSGPWLKAGIRANPTIIKPNREEMRQLTGKPLKTIDQFRMEGELLVKKGIKLVIISLAKEGALFISNKEAYHAIPPAIKIRTQVGLGDALVGGVMAGFERGLSLPETAKLGIAASLSAAIRGGPYLCRRSDLKRFVRKVRLRVL